MSEDKKTWTEEIGKLLKTDPRSEVEYCEYLQPDIKEAPEEVVRVMFRGGHWRDINVSCNSLGAIFQEIAREVYGSGAYGTFNSGWID